MNAVIAKLGLVTCLLASIPAFAAGGAGEHPVEGETRRWDNLRGPRGDGSATSDRKLTSLELAWKHSIGPGYSAVAVGGGRAVTAFSDGEQDVVVAWSTTDGKELWRTPIGPTYRGHDGSTDGPVGTPSLTDSRVYLMGPHGDLVALSLDVGAILWRRQLVDEWSAPEPIYGFGSSALEVDDVLVVPGGSETHAIVGLDPADGSRLWSLGALGVNYATPVRSGGELLVASALDVVAFDPREGKVLWSFRHSEQPPFDPTYPQLQPLEDGLPSPLDRGGQGCGRASAGHRLSAAFRPLCLSVSQALLPRAA